MSKEKIDIKETIRLLNVTDKPDSIEVSKNTRGDYSHKVKIYFNSDKNKEQAFLKAKECMKRLQSMFNIP